MERAWDILGVGGAETGAGGVGADGGGLGSFWADCEKDIILFIFFSFLLLFFLFGFLCCLHVSSLQAPEDPQQVLVPRPRARL